MARGRAGARRRGRPAPCGRRAAIRGSSCGGVERRRASASPDQSAPPTAVAPAPTPGDRSAAARAAGGRGAAAAPAAIEVAPISDVVGAGAGLPPRDGTRWPPGLWRDADPALTLAALDRLGPGALLSANALSLDLLSAAAPPPRAADPTRFFSARLNALTRFGAAERAAALAAQAGADLIRLGEAAALISGRDQALCGLLLQAPGPGETRLYCQLLAGETEAAALALAVRRDLGSGDETTLRLLEAIADPAAAEETAPRLSEPPAPLELAALRALGKPLPANFARTAPLSLAPAALTDAASPRARLEALERLEASGAASTDALRDAFSAQASAESGGVWGRVEAYLDGIEADPERFEAAAQRALAKAESEGRRGAMARLLAPEAAARGLPIDGGPDARYATPALRALLREGGEGEAAAALSRFAADYDLTAQAPDALERALDRLAAPGWRAESDADDAASLARMSARSPRAAFAVNALRLIEERAPRQAVEEALRFEADRAPPAHAAEAAPSAEDVAFGAAFERPKSPGQALLQALNALSAPQGPTADEALTALRILIDLDLHADARRIAIEMAMRLRR
ncbi:MAG: hypothetical protein AAGM38_14620 [Pseudomonadota bacterium]